MAYTLSMENFHALCLWADDNNISDTLFPRDIAKLSALKNLLLVDLELTEVPSILVVLQNLETLSLAYNNLTKLPPALFGLKNLETLHIQGNRITRLSESIERLTKLITLQAFDNELSSLPKNITKLENLEFLTLYYNSFSDEKLLEYKEFDFSDDVCISFEGSSSKEQLKELSIDFTQHLLSQS